MGVRKSTRFIPTLVGFLGRQELRAVARDALREIPGALDSLHEAMSSSAIPRDVRLQLPRAMSVFDEALVAPMLVKQLQLQEDGNVRYKVLRALVKLRRQTPQLALDEGPLQRVAELTLDHVDELRRWGDSLSAGSDEPPTSLVSADPLRAAHHLLVDLVRDKETHATQRVFLLLGLLYREDFEEIWRGLRSSNPKRRASSLELIENVVKPPLRTRVLGYVGDAAKSAKVTSETAYEDALREILARGGSTMRTLAEYRAHELGIDVSDIAPTRTSDATALATTLGQRIIDRAKNILPPIATGATRAPA
jgi:hypothetical protein